MAKIKPVRLVFASSDQVYPTRFARYRPSNENHPKEPYTFYGISKVLGEEMVKFYGRTEPNLKVSSAVFSHIEAAHELIDLQGEYSAAAFYVHGRVRSLKASSTHHAGATSQDELRQILAVLEPHVADDGPLRLALDQHGKPHTQELVDVREMVQGLLLIHDKREAIGETFNLAPTTPVSLAEFIPYLAEATGRRYVQVQIPCELGRTHGSSAKARAILGFAPEYTLFDMVDEAAGQEGMSTAPLTSGLVFPVDAVVAFAEELFARAGMPADKAASMAHALVEADMMGPSTHGLAIVPW